MLFHHPSPVRPALLSIRAMAPRPASARQRGMAVIAALLVVAAVTTIAAALMQRQSAYVQSVQAAQVRAELQAALQGGLMTAARQLRDAAARDARTYTGGIWARPIVDTRLSDVRGSDRPGPVLTGQVQDEQGKINLRSLVFEGRIDTTNLEQLRTLCTLAGVDPAMADRIAQRMLSAQPGGNETNSHGARAPTPRGLDDLRSLPGMDDATVARLRPHLTLLPNATLVNANTASAEVLAAIVPGLSLDNAKGLVAQRDSGQWFADQNDFVNRLNMPELAGNSVRVTVQSNWFQFVGAARLDQSIMLINALLLRTNQAAVYTIWSREGA